MASSGSDGLLFINLSNKTASPSKSFPCPVPLTLHARGASRSLPLSQAPAPVVPVQRYSQSIAAAAANSNISPKRARGEPAPPPLYFPRKSKIYPIMDSSPFSVNVISPQPDVQLAEAVPALAQGSFEYEVPLPRVEAVIAEAASVSTRWEAHFASSWRRLMFATTTTTCTVVTLTATGGTAAALRRRLSTSGERLQRARMCLLRSPLRASVLRKSVTRARQGRPETEQRLGSCVRGEGTL